ncbi:MAG: hypothetical protein PF689_03085 [Deltaproteobacteria bacterium]|jgi:hypothetical protein|nr:hypothetical protein [Deltaproteobacteria bacterium]
MKDEINHHIEQTEYSLEEAQNELDNVRDLMNELKPAPDRDKLLSLTNKIEAFLEKLIKKTQPCRIKTIEPVYDEEDPELVDHYEKEYFDWGFTEAMDNIGKFKEVLK